MTNESKVIVHGPKASKIVSNPNGSEDSSGRGIRWSKIKTGTTPSRTFIKRFCTIQNDKVSNLVSQHNTHFPHKDSKPSYF